MILILLLAVVFIMVIGIIIIRKSTMSIPHRNKNKNIKTPYTWWQILNPFNKEPFDIYGHLSDENKGAAWSVIGGIVVTMLTAWLGFSIQFMIWDQSQNEKDKIAHYEFVDKIYPMYESYMDSCNRRGVLDTLYYVTASDDSKLLKSHNIESYFENPNNWPDIVKSASSSLNLMGTAKKYFDKKTKEDIEKNNTSILLGILIYDNILSPCTKDSIALVNN